MQKFLTVQIFSWCTKRSKMGKMRLLEDKRGALKKYVHFFTHVILLIKIVEKRVANY
jgi:hypothetical protein